MLIIVMSYGAAVTTAQGPTSAPAPMVSPAPTATTPPVNLTQALISAGDFSVLLTLLNASGVGAKFQMQANNPEVGISIFAPKDVAFTKEPTATLLKNVTPQQVVALLEYHALNNWQSLSALQQTSNTEFTTIATTSNGGGFELNITFVQGQVQVVTAWNRATIASTLYDAKPVSVFALEEVLLPVDLFGLPASAPAPSPASGAPSIAPSSSSPPSSLSPPPVSGPSSAGPAAETGFAPQTHRPVVVTSLIFLSLLFFKLF
ncbi:hypothetical protein KP509_12G007500 [Ceratopteris richardii]|nr:hypothetical protein KP509_12G007500 [Ceratopteris richardii]